MLWARASPAFQSLTFIDRAQGRPGPPSPHFYRQGLSRPVPLIPHFYRQESLTFIDRVRPALPARPPNPSLLLANPSLLLARPLTSISQTPHFY